MTQATGVLFYTRDRTRRVSDIRIPEPIAFQEFLTVEKTTIRKGDVEVCL